MVLDLEETKKLLRLCTRSHTKNLLNCEVVRLETELQNRTEVHAAKLAKATKDADPASPVLTRDAAEKTVYTEIRKYALDQSKTHVKVYIDMDKIHEHDKDLITCEFTATSVDLIISNFEGVNHRLRNDLGGKIDAEESCFQIKEN